MDTVSSPVGLDAGLLDRLGAILGEAGLIGDEADRRFYSTDVHASAPTPAALVIRPETVEALASAVREITAAGVAIYPRGGGMSYTDAFLPTRAPGVVIDTGGLSRVVEINAGDSYVTVEPGISWAALDEALAPHGVRTPFWGPFSGHSATVGGSLSQNSVTYGSGTRGPAADSVIGYDIVTARGEILRTGAGGNRAGIPFFRHYGPDLTGLFSGDAGALGIKARVTLKLVPRRPVVDGISFGFESFEKMAAGMAAVARTDTCSEAFGLDPVLMAQNLGRENVEQDFKTLLKVGQAGRGPIDGLVQMARVVLAGRAYLKKVKYSAHWTFDALDRASADAMIAAARKAAEPFGVEMENSVPRIIRAFPFPPPTQILGPRGERWVPLHGILPFSKLDGFKQALDALYDRHRAEMDRLTVVAGAMFTTIDTNGFLYEIAFYWQDARDPYHDRAVAGDWAKDLPRYDANPEGYALVDRIKAEIIDLFAGHGATHMQVGKLYPWARDRNAPALSLVRAIKAETDPDGLINPGALGL